MRDAHEDTRPRRRPATTPSRARAPRPALPVWRSAPGVPAERSELLRAWRRGHRTYVAAQVVARAEAAPGLARFVACTPAPDVMARLEADRLGAALAAARADARGSVQFPYVRVASLVRLLDVLAGLSRHAA